VIEIDLSSVKNTQLRGSICAIEILISNDCLFLHHDSPGSLPGPGNLPKASDDGEISRLTNFSGIANAACLSQKASGFFISTSHLQAEMNLRRFAPASCENPESANLEARTKSRWQD